MFFISELFCIMFDQITRIKYFISNDVIDVQRFFFQLKTGLKN